MFQATVQMVVAITLGTMLSALLGRALGHHGYFSAELHDRYPTLEARLNDFIPQLLKGLRWLILVTVVSVVLDAWNVFNVAQWLASETGTQLIFTLVTVLLIVLAAKAFWIVVASWIEHRLSAETGSGEPSAREKTLLTIFRNAIMVTLIILTTMVVLSELGLNIGPLIAGAGVVGLAIGFGAQKLVQDIITGVFIQMENAINTGDIITVAGITGTAEKLTIRSLGLRDLEGTYHFIPFSSVDSVSNYMRDFAFHVGHYGIAYREDVDEAIVHLHKAFESLRDDLATSPDTADYLLEDTLAVDGVSALADSSVNIRVRIKTRAGVQWAVGRAYNGWVKKHFDTAGIEIPFPHTTLYFGEDKQGQAPVAPVRILPPAAD
jgi:small conductance mechanosensitive channel